MEQMVEWGGLIVQSVVAFVTLAAVLLALWVAQRESRWRECERRERLESAKIYAASLGNRVFALIVILTRISRHLTKQPGAELTADQIGAFLLEAINEINLLDVDAMATIDKQIAVDLMHSLDQMHAAKLYLNGYPDDGSIKQMTEASAAAQMYLRNVKTLIEPYTTKQ